MVSLVKDGLLKNLDEYVTAFGWDKFPPAQLAQNRVAPDGTRGPARSTPPA
jgi:raffinose/stachyose/melibiose transport system substrate-binding protein